MCNGCIYLRTSLDISALDTGDEKFRVSCIRYGLKLSGSYTKEELKKGVTLFSACLAKDGEDALDPTQDLLSGFTDELEDE